MDHGTTLGPTTGGAGDAGRVGVEDGALAAIVPGDGEMAARCRALDWAGTALGPVAGWSPSLRAAAALVVAAGFPMVLLWGPELVQIYNDGYRAVIGAKHPGGLGQPTRACWPEVWHLNAPVYERVWAGETVRLEDALYPITRSGALENAWFTVAYSPARDDAGAVGGILVTVVETTEHVVGRAAQAERDRLEGRLHGALLESALVLDQMSDAFLVMDGEFRIVGLNPSAERALGMPRSALIGRTHWQAFPASVGAESERHYRRVATERVPAHFAHHYVGEGHDFHLEIDAYPAGGDGVAVFWRDVSDRVRLLAAAEAARADAEARAATLTAVIESIPDAVLVARADAVTLANRAALDQLGVAPVADAGHHLDGPLVDLAQLDGALLDPRTGAPLPRAGTPIGRAFAGERSHAHVLLRAFGAADARPVRAAAAPIVGPGGSILGAVAVFTDMTAVQRAAAERERLLAELDAERTLLRTVLEQLPAAVFIVEAPSGRVVALNAAVDRIWGGPRPHTAVVDQYSAEWVGYHPDGRRVASDEWPVARAARYGETVTDWLGEIERPDGSRVLIEVSAAPVRDASGRTVAAVAVAADVTARARAAAERERLLHALEVERARLAYVFQQAPAFLAVARGPTHVFELANDAYARLVGRRDLIGRPVAEALPEVREQGFVALLDEVLATGEPFVGREVPVRLARTPGVPPEERFVDFVYLPLVEADGTRAGVIAHGTDVTEQVEARHEIERLLRASEQARAEAEAARVDAEAADRSKSEFLAVMSHELRTPLNAIGGYAELIEMGIRGPVTDAQRIDLLRIQRSQRHLLGLINGVLNYAKVGAGAMSYEVGDVPLAEVLATCEALVAPQARAKGIALEATQCVAGLAARADRDKVQQVVLNLLSNAVKFTAPGGRVTLACAPHPAAEGVGTAEGEPHDVEVVVTDTGRGIPADQLDRVFEPFVQVDARLTRTQDGTGLGLSISRDLARGMGGDLTAESTVGVGSAFRLTLPLAP